MRYEPAVDRERLIKTVTTMYGLPAERLSFIPVGFEAASYTLHCTGGERYFLKLWPEIRTRYTSEARRETILHLLRALYDRRLYPRVPYPIPTRDGALWARCVQDSFAIFPFLPGQMLPDEWSPTLQSEFAKTIATIHRATPGLTDVLPPREAFDIPFELDLRRGLQTIQRVRSPDRPTLRALREMILPRRDDILAQLARLHHLQAIVRLLHGPYVLCHTDLGGDNLLVDDDGFLYVLDWDGATLAPPEHDLQEARWMDMEHILASYMAAGGSGPLHLDHFAFYLLRRHLNDMTVRFLQVLDGNGSTAEDEDAMGGIEAWGFAQWSSLDVTLDRIRAVLRHMQ